MTQQRRLPPWFKVKMPGGPRYLKVKALLRQAYLHTVCEEAHCPNIGQCFEEGTATFLILGEKCTRRCGFCAITSQRPQAADPEEPERVAQIVKLLELKYVVITSVTRDDLPDGGGAHFAQTIAKIREHSPECEIEVLVPDFRGSEESLMMVVAASPDVLGHNLETVPRLYSKVRPQTSYHRSLELLSRAKMLGRDMITKSGLMLGLGEGYAELLEVMADLRQVNCDILTLGQYLSPSPLHQPVAKYYTPHEFDELGKEAERMGFGHVESGPLVRSSYQAHRYGARL
ncbi:MAG: lipoyl synthase [Chloroflexi bacterium]|nr:lipoyl synthase [Chloroflexota bacterium]